MNWRFSIPFLRIVLAIFLFQFLVPAFLISGDQAEPHSSHVVLHQWQENFAFPVFLKEKDEHEFREGRQQDFDARVLIDLSHLSSALIETHEARLDPVIHNVRSNTHPPFHILHCIYLI